MTCYETLFVVKPTLTDEETATQITNIKEIISNEGAELLATDDMGMRKLAYEVEKNARGYYTVLFYKAEGTLITELERKLKINEDVLKFLTVKYVKNKELTQFNKLVESANRKSAIAEEVVVPETVAVEEVKTAETTEA
ncbi:SSU ribosomal protein S6p [hydrothermal vent metagenome]|uniref:SSU ribosomal protein S6p n=1 Tax=hydrothermal vent metagenome TaxID=652676 RepID=A0A1W1CZU9_9ZZZZ